MEGDQPLGSEVGRTMGDSSGTISPAQSSQSNLAGPSAGAPCIQVQPQQTSNGAATNTSGTFLIWIHNVSPQHRYTVVRTSKGSSAAQVIEQVLQKSRQSDDPNFVAL